MGVSEFCLQQLTLIKYKKKISSKFNDINIIDLFKTLRIRIISVEAVKNIHVITVMCCIKKRNYRFSHFERSMKRLESAMLPVLYNSMTILILVVTVGDVASSTRAAMRHGGHKNVQRSAPPDHSSIFRGVPFSLS